MQGRLFNMDRASDLSSTHRPNWYVFCCMVVSVIEIGRFFAITHRPSCYVFSTSPTAGRLCDRYTWYACVYIQLQVASVINRSPL